MSLAEMWNNAPPEGATERREVADLKDGVYVMEVQRFRFFQSKDGPYYHCWELVVVDGLNKGAYTEKFSGCSEISMDILRKDVRRIADRWVALEELYDEKADRLGPAVGELIGAVIEVQKKDDPRGKVNRKTGRPYFNLNFLSLVSAPGGVVPESEVPETAPSDLSQNPVADEPLLEDDDDDDIPF